MAAALGAGITGIGLYLRLVAPLYDAHQQLRHRLLGSLPITAIEHHGPDTERLESLDQMLQTVDMFKDMAVHLADQGGRIALASAEVSIAADRLQLEVQADNRELNDIKATVHRIQALATESADSAATGAEMALRAQRASSIGQEAVNEAAEKMRATSRQARQGCELVAAMENKSAQIETITALIGGIAEHTKLLALNAVAEAARVGEQGRGFAMAAEEVRDLAGKTATAADEIGAMVSEISTDISGAVETMSDLSTAVAEGADLASNAGRQLTDIFTDIETIHRQVQAIADDTSANCAEVGRTSTCMQTLGSRLQETESQAGLFSKQSEQLSTMVETIHGSVLTVEGQSQHARMQCTAQDAAYHVAGVFEDALGGGDISEDELFDRDYQPIADTDPPKYKTGFDDFTDRILPAIQEPILELDPQVVYAVAVDNNGYLPTHNRRFSSPLIGDHQTDLHNNRTKRIFSDRTGSRSGSSTATFLLQTYKRDTGEVMHDISVPIYVDGRHWGGFRIGYRAAQTD
jgi:methyl-accepting chemotaxis protein